MQINFVFLSIQYSQKIKEWKKFYTKKEISIENYLELRLFWHNKFNLAHLGIYQM